METDVKCPILYRNACCATAVNAYIVVKRLFSARKLNAPLRHSARIITLVRVYALLMQTLKERAQFRISSVIILSLKRPID